MEGQTSITTTLRTCSKPKLILHYERYKLAMCRQNDFNIQDFVADLKRFPNSRDYGTLRDDLLLTQFIIGVNGDSLRMRLLTRADLTFDTAVQEALLVTESGIAVRRLQNDCSGGAVGSVNVVNELTKRVSNTRGKNDRDAQGQDRKCLGCGGRHTRSKCRFASAKCFNCGKMSHIARVCKQIKPSQVSEMQLPGDLGMDEIELKHCVTCKSQHIV